MTLSTVTALAKLFGQYLLQPIPFTLTFLLPLLFRLIARKYIWLSLPLATLAEVLLNWDSFCYYEARGLALLFTLTQLAAMAVFVWILQAAAKNSRETPRFSQRIGRAGPQQPGPHTGQQPLRPLYPRQGKFLWLQYAAAQQRQRPLDAQHRLPQAGQGDAVPWGQAVGHHCSRPEIASGAVPRQQ